MSKKPENFDYDQELCLKKVEELKGLKTFYGTVNHSYV